MRLLKQADGPQNSFYANGKKHMETFVKGGKFDTYYLVYSFKGDTLVYFELKDGLLHGKYLIKNEDGSLHTSGFYEEGTEVGEWKIHGVRGIPQRHFEYDRNANSGDKKYTYEFTFYENGNLEKKSYFKDGLLQDWVISFHPNGLIKDSIFFVNDTLNGKYVSYTDEGKLYSIRYFEKGKRVGWGQDWYYKTDGKGIMREEQYKNGIRDGLARYYHKNGNLHLLAYFKDGKEDSTWMYYDSLGVLTNTVYHKMGVKKEVPLVGPCSCRDKARSKGFAQSLSGLLNDETDINLWQFPFHESITPILDQSFFRNLQTDNNRRSSFYSFDLITFKPIQIGIPGKSGIKLWLNPCLHDGEESSLDIGLNFTQKKPDETRVEIGSNRIAYILPTRFFKSINAAPKEVLAHVKLNYLVYSQKGIEFKDAHSICMDKAFLLNSNYTLNIDTFSLLDIDPSPQHSDLRYLTFYNYNLLGKEMVKALQDDPIFIYEAKGSLQLVYNRKSIKADVSQLLVSNKVVAGFLSIPKVEAKDAQLYYSDGFAQFVINEKALYQQMKQDGFTKVYGAYNPKEKVLEILFYIHKP
ncbi:MAG: toxin-antitoxin system YwqK family antitoxin, partial [Bacteroidia bacterium]|nr:toxin-antitoxin system YwqK family antitoxin [Bacteroidia bacterium]